MDFFDEISKAKRELPKVNAITNEVRQKSLNFYQVFAIGLLVIAFFLGIIFGNLFATCEASSYFYSTTCAVTQFNFSLMILIWIFGSLLSLFIFAIGHIIALLSQINEKLTKFVV